jgi:hypothetical protein
VTTAPSHLSIILSSHPLIIILSSHLIIILSSHLISSHHLIIILSPHLISSSSSSHLVSSRHLTSLHLTSPDGICQRYVAIRKQLHEVPEDTEALVNFITRMESYKRDDVPKLLQVPALRQFTRHCDSTTR